MVRMFCFFIILIIFSLSCNLVNTKTKYLKDNFTIVPSLDSFLKIPNYYSKPYHSGNICDSIRKTTLTFYIRHYSNIDLNGVFFEVFIGGNQLIKKGFYSNPIITDSFDFCYGKRGGNYIWFTAYDTLNKVMYSWGQKNSIPYQQSYNIKLLSEKNAEENQYIIE